MISARFFNPTEYCKVADIEQLDKLYVWCLMVFAKQKGKTNLTKEDFGANGVLSDTRKCSSGYVFNLFKHEIAAMEFLAYSAYRHHQLSVDIVEAAKYIDAPFDELCKLLYSFGLLYADESHASFKFDEQVRDYFSASYFASLYEQKNKYINFKHHWPAEWGALEDHVFALIFVDKDSAFRCFVRHFASENLIKLINDFDDITDHLAQLIKHGYQITSKVDGESIFISLMYTKEFPEKKQIMEFAKLQTKMLILFQYHCLIKDKNITICDVMDHDHGMNFEINGPSNILNLFANNLMNNIEKAKAMLSQTSDRVEERKDYHFRMNK